MDCSQSAERHGVRGGPRGDSDSDNEDESTPQLIGRRPRRSFTLQFKLEAIAKLETGTSLNQLSRELGVDRKCLRKWRNDQAKFAAVKHKRLSRSAGSGRKALYPELDRVLLNFFRAEREKRHSVTYKCLRQFLTTQKTVPIPIGFQCSDKYLFAWSRRHKLACRRITHHGQFDSRSPEEIQQLTLDHLNDIRIAAKFLDASKIINMDEVPCYFDMVRDRTLHFVGSKNVDGADTGYRKHRYTVCLSVTAEGLILKPMIIFRGLKRAPMVNNNKVVVTASKSGSMDANLAKMWMDKVFSCRGPFLSTTRSLLIWDSYGSHKKDDVIQHCRLKFNSRIALIPGKTTAFLQPLDVGINGPFKAAMRREWDDWVSHGPNEQTAKGYRKRPSYEAVANMVAKAVEAINQDTVRRAFETCGIAEFGGDVPSERLNGRLKKILEWQKEGFQEIEMNEEDDDGGLYAGSGDEELLEQSGSDASDSDGPQ